MIARKIYVKSTMIYTHKRKYRNDSILTFFSAKNISQIRTLKILSS